jgi:hypothetical protein
VSPTAPANRATPSHDRRPLDENVKSAGCEKADNIDNVDNAFGKREQKQPVAIHLGVIGAK